MKPPYNISPDIMQLVTDISEKIGEINASYLFKPIPELRKKNRIKTIQSTLELEGNSINESQITAILENKRVIAPEKDILEVQNAIKVYDSLEKLNAFKMKDLLKAHSILMKGLIENPGKFRASNVGIVKGSLIQHIAPSGSMVYPLMKNLFKYLKEDKEIVLIKSCVFHYEFEFIHPFSDGNGRMGRMWQTILLMNKYPVFEYLPIESLIKINQKEYYSKLSESDKVGNSTPFIGFMLRMILISLEDLLKSQNFSLKTPDRIAHFKEFILNEKFSRIDYLNKFKNISIATASRDLKWAVQQGILTKTGNYRLTEYKYI